MLVLLFVLWSTIISVVHCGSAAALANRLQERVLLSETKQDILSDELLQRSFPFLKSSCVKEALKHFLPACLKQGVESIDASFRVETAVKLSICEFQASGLKHIPEACQKNGPDSLMDCMIQLESSTQWWTTYSGNYQRLSSICFENSLPFEKDQILSLFLNITNMQVEISDNLSKYFYNMMSNVESSAESHLKTIIELFNEYMNQFQEVFKDKRNVFKNEFEEFQEDIQSVMVHNADLLKEKDIGFMQSVDSLQKIIDGILIQLKENDISSQIIQLRNDNLHDVKEMERLTQEMFKFQIQGQNQMGYEMKRFFDDTLQNMALVSHEVEKSQATAAEVTQVFDQFKSSLIPSIMKELSPQLLGLKNDLLEDWKSAMKIVSRDFTLWNSQINESFEEISSRLNSTMETINDIDRSFSNLKNIMTGITRIFGYLGIFGHSTFRVLCYIMHNKHVWIFTAILIFVKQLTFWLPWRKLLSLFVSYGQFMVKCGIIAIAIYSGSKFGKTIMSINS
ncbi:related to Nuclear fusion protein KAR5 [Zygosaccharomyces bailii]|nr:related to Nuclear fusion protein KAR5 [Zygosaccharomyces bailii]